MTPTEEIDSLSADLLDLALLTDFSGYESKYSNWALDKIENATFDLIERLQGRLTVTLDHELFDQVEFEPKHVERRVLLAKLVLNVLLAVELYAEKPLEAATALRTAFDLLKTDICPMTQKSQIKFAYLVLEFKTMLYILQFRVQGSFEKARETFNHISSMSCNEKVDQEHKFLLSNLLKQRLLDIEKAIDLQLDHEDFKVGKFKQHVFASFSELAAQLNSVFTRPKSLFERNKSAKRLRFESPEPIKETVDLQEQIARLTLVFGCQTKAIRQYLALRGIEVSELHLEKLINKEIESRESENRPLDEFLAFKVLAL